MTLMYMTGVEYDVPMTAPKSQRQQSIHRARNKLAEIIERARFLDEPTKLLNRGKPVAVVVSVDFYERALAAFGEERVTIEEPDES